MNILNIRKLKIWRYFNPVNSKIWNSFGAIKLSSYTNVSNLKKALQLTLIFISFSVLGVSKAFGRSTLEQIMHNKPDIELIYATRLAMEIDIAADMYKVPANVLAAICRVESSYILGAVNKRSNDYGLMQVNMFNIKAYKLDRHKLTTDMAYAVQNGAMIFSWFYRRYSLDHSIQRYNGGTGAGVVEWKSTLKYLRLVKKYM